MAHMSGEYRHWSYHHHHHHAYMFYRTYVFLSLSFRTLSEKTTKLIIAKLRHKMYA